MPDWSSLEELNRDGDVFVKLVHSLMGVYAWECFLSLDFDFAFITGQKTFRWPMIFYFANRYLLLCALAGILVSFDSTSQLNCQPLYIFNQLAGNASTGLASINLCLRTIAVYGNYKPITILLVILILGHWSLILMGVQLTVTWSDEQNACVIVATNNTILAVTFIYSMCFDLIVFLLNAYKLSNRRGKHNLVGESRLGKMIFSDGLIYFFVAFLANLIATVFMLLKLNSIMTIIFNVPAVIASTICATRAVRRLNNFKNEGAEVFSGSGTGSGIRVTHGQPRPIVSTLSRSGTAARAPGGVHVQMETFTRAEDADFQRQDDRDTDFDVEAKGSPI
ncbi:hypothetical protein E1B28_006130 [Marasmius oreades]|uniref:Transmembrane protein n=1 Tax=Marasmius oreades TaxID=181124 RepID=A0A9P7UUY8_9AGAR|nr:uncharacterized protein E1B28_006130 [Marasmius oreades]KAG7095372.1 hypothetical protein E1B28_006130 [Marasmius oreades]